MKKFFTLIAAALLSMGASAQSSTWSDVADAGKLEGTYSNGDFKLTRVDTDNKHSIDENAATFGTAAEPVKFTHRLKTGGKSSNKNGLSLTIPSAGTLKVYVRTGSNSATDRNIVLTQGSSELYNKVVQESDVTETIDDTNVYPVISVSVVAGTVEVTYPVNSLNFYGFEFVAGEGGEQGGEGGEGGEQGGDTPAGSALIDYPTSLAGIAIGGTCTTNETVKIHGNKDAVQAIQFKNGYTTDNVINANHATLTVDGGFKAGDVITVAGVFNNADDTKQSAVTLFTGEEGEKNTDIWTSQLFINGRTATEDPTPETYTLEADYASLKLGRANGLTGATGTWVTLLKVERTGTGISEVLNVKVAQDGAIYNMAGQKVDASYKGIVIQNGRKFVNK